MTQYRSAALSSLLLSLGLVFSGNALAEEGDPQRGSSLANTCVACHGPGGRSNIPDMYPHLAGRDASELAEMLTDFREGDRQEAQMSPQAQGLSDQDIADLAAFFSEQEPAE